MSTEVLLLDDPVTAMERAGAFLATRPVEHNLILTLLRARIERPEPGRYWVVSQDERVVGLGFQSPLGYYVTVTPMPAPAVDALVEAVLASGASAPGVSGDAATAARFAGQWTERRGTAATPHMGMRVYALGDLVPPQGVPGRLRTATLDDAPTVLDLVEVFHRDTGQEGVVSPDEHLGRVAAGAYVLWEDEGVPVSMAARTAPVEGMSRVYAVVTPPALRGRGYASATVAELSAWIRADGADAMLYTDLGNPTSNSVYRRIGYRAVAENLQYRFA